MEIAKLIEHLKHVACSIILPVDSFEIVQPEGDEEPVQLKIGLRGRIYTASLSQLPKGYILVDLDTALPEDGPIDLADKKAALRFIDAVKQEGTWHLHTTVNEDCKIAMLLSVMVAHASACQTILTVVDNLPVENGTMHMDIALSHHYHFLKAYVYHGHGTTTIRITEVTQDS